MSAPVYSTDLTVLTDMELDVTDEMTGHSGGAAPSDDGDYFIQGSACNSQALGTKTGTQIGMMYNHGSDVSGSLSSGDCFFFWQVLLAGNAMDTFDNGGLRLMIGGSTGNFSFWKSGGSDFGRNPYGGWQNVAIDPTGDSDYTDGSPTGAYQYFGSLMNLVSAVQKGSMHAMDILTYGRGELKVINGDVGAGGVGTFTGMATQNDGDTNSWGLFQAQGTGYLWKGLLSFGDASNSCYFTSSNVNITVDRTPRTYKAFNRIEINNINSIVNWTAVNISTLIGDSQISFGQFEMGDSAAVSLNTCVFTDMDTFIFKSSATVDNCTFRRCNMVTQGGSDFDDCVFDNCGDSVSLYVSNLNNVDGCDFTSDGSNHAIELTSAHADGSYTLTNCTYTDYASTNGSTGNECIYNNSGDSVTINVSGGNTPTIRNGTSANTYVLESVPIKVTVKDGNDNFLGGVQTAVYLSSNDTEVMNEDTVLTFGDSGEANSSFGGSTPTACYIRCRKASTGATKYIPFSGVGTIQSTSGLNIIVTLTEQSIT